MIRVLTILAAIAALAVSAAPVASAGNSKKPPPRVLSIGSTEVFELNTLLKRPRAITKLSALHENEGIDGGFKAKSRLKAAPKPINPKPLSLNTNSGDDT